MKKVIRLWIQASAARSGTAVMAPPKPSAAPSKPGEHHVAAHRQARGLMWRLPAVLGSPALGSRSEPLGGLQRDVLGSTRRVLAEAVQERAGNGVHKGAHDPRGPAPRCLCRAYGPRFQHMPPKIG